MIGECPRLVAFILYQSFVLIAAAVTAAPPSCRCRQLHDLLTSLRGSGDGGSSAAGSNGGLATAQTRPKMQYAAAVPMKGN